MKRIILFLATNLAVMLVLSIVLNVFGVGPESGLNVNALLVFSLMIGFAGSIISLLISKPMAKWTIGARVIDPPHDSTEQRLVNTVRDLSQRARLASPRPMINALARLGGLAPSDLPQSFKASGITARPGWLGILATHPPIDKRIAALQSRV
jgi:Zn-dependent protease with chaperone function